MAGAPATPAVSDAPLDGDTGSPTVKRIPRAASSGTGTSADIKYAAAKLARFSERVLFHASKQVWSWRDSCAVTKYYA